MCGCGALAAVNNSTGANQTYNVGVNFANRGEGSEVDMPTLAGCYAAACASALGVAYAGQRMVPKVPTCFRNPQRLLLAYTSAPCYALRWYKTVRSAATVPQLPCCNPHTRRARTHTSCRSTAERSICVVGRGQTGALATLVPFTAVSLAGILNVLLTRSNELVDGLELTTADGEHVGMSRLAAQVRVLLTASCTPHTHITLLVKHGARARDRDQHVNKNAVRSFETWSRANFSNALLLVHVLSNNARGVHV